MMQTFRLICLAIFLISIMECTIGSIAADEQAASLEIPAERRPYHVQLLVAFDLTSFDSIARQKHRREIQQTTQRCVGDLWAVETTEISWLDPVSEQGLARLGYSVLEKHLDAKPADVVFAAVVESRPVGKRVSVRSWQPEVQTESQVVSTDVRDDRDLAVALIRLCRDLFRPMGIVVQASDRSIQIQLRGGELSSPDLSFAQLA